MRQAFKARDFTDPYPIRAGEEDRIDSDEWLMNRELRAIAMDDALRAQEVHIQAVYDQWCRIESRGEKAGPIRLKYDRMVAAHRWSLQRRFCGSLEQAMEAMDRETRSRAHSERLDAGRGQR